MNKKNYIDMREPLINTSPLYNPMGNGEETEFSDEKSFSHMMNENTEKEKEKRDRKIITRLKKKALYIEEDVAKEKMELEMVLNALHLDVKGELDAIQLYEHHIQIIKEPIIKNKLIEISNEEKHHLKELMELIENYQLMED